MPPMALPKNAGAKKSRRARRRDRVVEQQIAGLEVVDGGAVVYQLERVRCGKPGCRVCCVSSGHGPYWYAYWREKGATRSIYIGKRLRSVQQAREERKKG